MPRYYTNHINSIAAETLREEKLVKKLLFVLPCLASPHFYHFYPSLQSNKTSTVPTSFSLLQGNFVLPSLFSFLHIVFIYFFLHVFYSSSLFYISPFSYSPVSSLSPSQTHTHADCKPLNSKLCWASSAKAVTSLPIKAGHCCPSHVLHSCTGCTGIFTESNVSGGYWWDFLSDLWSCACREKETIPNTTVVQGSDAGMRGYSVCNWKLCTSMGKKRQKNNQKLFSLWQFNTQNNFTSFPEYSSPESQSAVVFIWGLQFLE